MNLIDVQNFYTEAPLQSDRLIPNQVYQTWKTSMFDPGHARLLDEFCSANPEFGFHFFDDARMHAYMESAWGNHQICDIFSRTRHGATKADIWRYCILYERGGIYLDIDSTLGFKLESLPKEMSELISFEGNKLQSQMDPRSFPGDLWFFQNQSKLPPCLQHPDHTVLNWCLMFKPGHPILSEAIRIIVEHADEFRSKIFPNIWSAVIHFTGPLVLTRAVWNHVLLHGDINQMGIDFSGMGIFKAVGAGVYSNAPHYTEKRNEEVLG